MSRYHYWYNMNAATAFCFSLTNQLVLCLALLLQWPSAQEGRKQTQTYIQHTATYQQGWTDNQMESYSSQYIKPACSDDQPKFLLPFAGFGNLGLWRSPPTMWSRSLCRSQSPSSPTPGSPFIFFSSPLIIQLPQLPFLSPPLPAGPSGSLGDEGILGKRDVEPTDQNGCPPPVQSIIMKKRWRRKEWSQLC